MFLVGMRGRQGQEDRVCSACVPVDFVLKSGFRQSGSYIPFLLSIQLILGHTHLLCFASGLWNL